jgi:hypothetical protein
MAKLPSLSYVSVSIPTIRIAKSAYFVICMLDRHPYQNLCRSFVEVVHFDFLTETPLLLLCASVPKTDHDNPYVHPRVRGDIAVVGIYTTSQMLLINWKTESCIILSFSSVCSLLCLANSSSHRLSTDSVRRCSCLWVYYRIRTRSSIWYKPYQRHRHSVLGRVLDAERFHGALEIRCNSGYPATHVR